MATISSLGSGSGLDLETLLSGLLDAEATPVKSRLDTQEANIYASISAFGTLTSVLSEFQSASQSLTDDSAFISRSATSSNKTLFSVTASEDATPASYDIQVLNLASRQKLSSGDFASPDTTIGTGSLTISAGTDSFSLDITSGSLANIKDAINNAEDNFGVTATVITVDDGLGGTVSKLLITAAETGDANALTITVDDDDGTDVDNSGLSQLFYDSSSLNSQLTEISQAANARITIDGFTASSASNVFDSVIEGVTITALSETVDPDTDPAATLTVTRDTSSVKSSIKGFVDAYNNLVDILAALSSADPEAGTSSALSGDFTVRSIGSQLRSILSSQMEGLSDSASSLVALGVTTNKDGHLQIDSTKLNNAVAGNLDEIATLFQSENGIANRIDQLMDRYLQTGGLIDSRESTLNNSLEDIADQREALNIRLAALEDRYRQRFSALDSLISQLNSTSNFLTSQLAITSSIISGKKSNNDQ